MREYPILFNTEMVRALLDGRKTATRRLVKDPYYIEDEEMSRISGFAIHKGTAVTHGMPYPDAPYSAGDILYVRETWGDYREHTEDGEGAYFLYRADYPDGAISYQYPGGPVCDLPQWHPSIHMPKEAARIWLKVTDVRIERLRDITEEDAVKEGLYKGWRLHGKGSLANTARQAFMWLWLAMERKDDYPAKYCWALNPWVWVIEFERCEKPENKKPTLRYQGGPVIQKDHEDNTHCTKISAGCQGGDG